MKALVGAAVLALACSSLSGCFCVTNLAVVGLGVGQPSKIDPAQPAVAVKDIVGLSARATQSGYVLYVNALLEDGRTVPLVSARPATDVGDPSVVPFVRAEGPMPPSDCPLVVPDWSWSSLDEKRTSDPTFAIGVGCSIHRVVADGSIMPELTRLTAGLAATCGLVTIHLVRDPGLRRQTWQIALYPPHSLERAGLLTEDSSLYGPLPPAGSAGKVILFGAICPFTVVADLVLWGSCIGMAVEMPLGFYMGWQ